MEIKRKTSINLYYAGGYILLALIFFALGGRLLITEPDLKPVSVQNSTILVQNCKNIADKLGLNTVLEKESNKLLVFSESAEITQEKLALYSTVAATCSGLTLDYFCAGTACSPYKVMLKFK